MLKPLIPRRLQLLIRRLIIRSLRIKHENVWPIDESSSKKPVDWKGWPDGKQFALVLTHDVETARGQDRCRDMMRLEEELGFRSSFNFVPERYQVSPELRHILEEKGFEVGVHGLCHDGKYYLSRKIFRERAKKINKYLKEWGSVGYRAPSMLHKLDWFHDLNISYDASTFDTDPFEPYSESMCTIFPFVVQETDSRLSYVELPYTLPQDHALFVIMQEKTIDVWKRKLDWVAEHGGMALLITHPDYMKFNGGRTGSEEYPAEYYREFLKYVQKRYKGQYWLALPKEIARNVTQGKCVLPEDHKLKLGRPTGHARKKTIWIDLDNSPHIPFFKPIIEKLEQRGYKVVLSARDCFQTCELADVAGFSYQRIGHHYGKNMMLKLAGLAIRTLQMVPFVWREKPDLAVSHGSRSQHLISFLGRVPVIDILDYEHAKIMPLVNFVRIIIPDVIPSEAVPIAAERIFKYPGIKEDVYVPGFLPDPALLDELGIGKDRIVISIRPPATEAHYRSIESEVLFDTTIEYLAEKEDTCLVMLPRNDSQKAWIIERWPGLCSDGKILFPQKVVDGLNLIWCSDLVISGGGTMNREAAALGVPVYSIFRGKTGAVDRYLAANGRLVLLESPDDVRRKIKVERRRTGDQRHTNTKVLDAIVNGIVSILEAK